MTNVVSIKKTTVLDLKTEFLEIQKKHIGESLTREKIEEIVFEYTELFKKYELNEIKWTILSKENPIIFYPIRNIDKLAIAGILSTVNPICNCKNLNIKMGSANKLVCEECGREFILQDYN